MALAHHRITIPENLLLTVSVELSYNEGDEQGIVIDWMQIGAQGGASHLPMPKLPAIKNAQALKLRYVLPHYGAGMQSDFILKLRRLATGGRVRINNYQFASVPLEGGRDYKPGVQLESSTPRLAQERFVLEPSEHGPGEMCAIQVDRGACEKAGAQAFFGAEQFAGLPAHPIPDGYQSPCTSN